MFKHDSATYKTFGCLTILHAHLLLRVRGLVYPTNYLGDLTLTYCRISRDLHNAEEQT